MSLLYGVSFIFVALFALGFTIFIHELGHFLAARKRGLVIKRFSIGFGPKIFGWTRNGVEYRLSAIPFGGYARPPSVGGHGAIGGGRRRKTENGQTFADKDESERKTQRTRKTQGRNSSQDYLHGQNDRFGHGSRFQRASRPCPFMYPRNLRIRVADSQLTTKIGFVPDTIERWNPHVEKGEQIAAPAKKGRLLAGDRIKSVDGVEVEDFMQIQSLIVTGKGMTEEGKRLVTLAIERNGEEKIIEVQPVVTGSEEYRIIGIEPEGNFTIALCPKICPRSRRGWKSAINPSPLMEQKSTASHSFRITCEKPMTINQSL